MNTSKIMFSHLYFVTLLCYDEAITAREDLTMFIRKFNAQDAEKIAVLLNEHLPFQEESAQTVLDADGIRYVCEYEDKIIGYIAGIELNDSREEMPFFERELLTLHEKVRMKKTMYTTYLVVHPAFRGQRIGRQLVEAYMGEVKRMAQLLIVVGWVQSDTNRWDAERLFTSTGLKPYRYIRRYFEPYHVYCPNCNGNCYCDAHIHWMELNA